MKDSTKSVLRNIGKFVFEFLENMAGYGESQAKKMSKNRNLTEEQRQQYADYSNEFKNSKDKLSETKSKFE